MADPDLLLRSAILFAAAAVQGFFGFGFGIVAMTGLSFGTDLIHAAGVVNATGLTLTGWMTLHLRASVLWRLYLRILPFLIVGIAVGVTALSSAGRSTMLGLLGVSVVAISAWNIASPHLRTTESRALDASMGLLGGLLGGAFNTGGPPLVVHLYRRADPPEALKATVQALFMTIGLTRLPLAGLYGQLDASVWGEVVLGIPLVVGGAWTGAVLARRVDAQRFRRVCWIGLGVLGVALLWSR